MLPNELIDQFLDQRYWVFILYCILIELAIILYWSELAILLFDEEEGGQRKVIVRCVYIPSLSALEGIHSGLPAVIQGVDMSWSRVFLVRLA